MAGQPRDRAWMVSEYQRERLAQRDNYERLKQERRAREASTNSK